jgi:thiamine-monophosphate kinase
MAPSTGSRGMSGPDDHRFDEFDWIEQDLKPLAEGAPESLGLSDDAAVIPGRPGFDLVVSKDAIVAGVHFLPDDSPDLVARKLLRVNLSDLAAKGAEPYGYFLAVAWPTGATRATRRAFAAGLKADQAEFGLRLMGGDTVSTPGPFTASLTILGWVPTGGMIRRDGAMAGDVVLVSGTIGDGGLGLRAAQGDLAKLSEADRAWLSDRYRLPRPRLHLGRAMRGSAHAAADISDGLIADAGRIAAASGVGMIIDLDRIPRSAPAGRWLADQPDRAGTLSDLATVGDDYEIVCTGPAEAVEPLQSAARSLGFDLTEVGRVTDGAGVKVVCGDAEVSIDRPGYRHA